MAYKKRALDGSAEFYQYVDQVVFSIHVQLKKHVLFHQLKEAIGRSFKAFPEYKVKVKQGFFNYYYTENTNPLPIHQEIVTLPTSIDFKANEDYLFKVSYMEQTIYFQFHHSLCDGVGALAFVEEVITQYLTPKIPLSDIIKDMQPFKVHKKIKKVSIQELDNPLDYTTLNPYFDFEQSSNQSILKSYKLNLEKLKQEAIKYRCSITVLVLSYLYYTFILTQKESLASQKIRFSIPINLRNRFSGTTPYNFASSLPIDLCEHEAHHSLESCMTYIKSYYDQILTKEHYQNALIHADTLQRGIFRILPIKLKQKLVMLSRKEQDIPKMINLSNLGCSHLASLQDRIEGIDFVLPAGNTTPISIGIVTLGRELKLNMTTRYLDECYFALLEEIFFDQDSVYENC